jgi:hypothetical protein
MNANARRNTIRANARRNTQRRREMHVPPRERMGRGPATLPGIASLKPHSLARERTSFNIVQHAAPDVNVQDNAGEGPSLAKKIPW